MADVEGSGIHVTPVESEVDPPVTVEEESQQVREQVVQEQQVVRGKVPLKPAAIKLPASVGGRALAELSGYPGFKLTDEEVESLIELWLDCGIQASPFLQAIIGSTALIGLKVGGYAAWVRAGRPGDLRKVKDDTEGGPHVAIA